MLLRSAWWQLALFGVLVTLPSPPTAAQELQWWEEMFRNRPSEGRGRTRAEDWDGPRSFGTRTPDVVQDGGPRPEIAPTPPAIIVFDGDFPADSIVIDTGGRKLYYVLSQNRAYAYDIAVGREGFNWSGVETISRKQAWPDWHPPAEMRERDPSLPQKMTGGVRNPLGAVALYLGNTLYRIHGTNDAKSIGRAQSSGCFRMLNSAVLHLASIAKIGTTVAVVGALPKPQQVSRATEPPMDLRGEPPRELRDPASVSTASSPTRTGRSPPLAPDYQALRNQTLGRR